MGVSQPTNLMFDHFKYSVSDLAFCLIKRKMGLNTIDMTITENALSIRHIVLLDCNRAIFF